MFSTKFEIAECDESLFTVWLSELELKSKIFYDMNLDMKLKISDVLFNVNINEIE